jgi:hypothetical protein
MEQGYQNRFERYDSEDAEAFNQAEADARIFEQAYGNINPGFPLRGTYPLRG